jgi:anti-anti-sigma factor
MVGRAVVTLPAEIDMGNADSVSADLQAAFAPTVTIVVADLTATTFCDSRGIRALVLAQKHSAASGAELRLVVPSATHTCTCRSQRQRRPRGRRHR